MESSAALVLGAKKVRSDETTTFLTTAEESWSTKPPTLRIVAKIGRLRSEIAIVSVDGMVRTRLMTWIRPPVAIRFCHILCKYVLSQFSGGRVDNIL